MPEKPIADMSVKDLDALLNDPIEWKKFAEAGESKKSDDAVITDDPASPFYKPKDETPPAPPTPDAVPSEAQPVPSDPPVESKSEDLDREILNARIEELTSQVAKLEKLAGRQAGEIGFKQQQKIRELEAEVSRLRDQRGDDSLGEPAEVETRLAPKSTRSDGVTTYLVGMAVNNAGAAFFQSYPDAQEMLPEIKEYLNQSGRDPKVILESDDPVEAARQATLFMEEAYAHVKLERRRQARTELEKKRADQLKGLEEAKRKASLSGSGSSAPPPVQPKPTQRKSLAELESELKQLDEAHGRRI